MADDKTVLGLMSVVASNIDRLRQSISSLRQLHDRWKDGNSTFINLIAQLTALKSSLGEMQDWMNYAINDMHEQLLMDLDVLMTSCGILVRNLDALVVQLRQPYHDNADWAIKLKFQVGSRSMNRLRNVAKRQTDAVNLLLAACKCHATAQRKILLHKSREIRKEDASSLSALMRTSKWNSRCIGLLSQISRMIQWFRVLFYVRLFHGSNDDMPTQQDYINAAAAMHSEAIDRRLKDDAITLRRETKLVLNGSDNSGKDLIMRQMKVLYAEGYPREERMKYRSGVRSTMRVVMHAMIDLLKDTGVSLSEDLNQDFAILLQEVETDYDTISAAAVQAVENIWKSEEFSTIYVKNFEIDFPQYAPYFATEIDRISEVDYIPTEADIVRLNTSSGGIKELRFSWAELDVHLFNLSGYISSPFARRWFHQLEGCTAFIYTADVSTYDRLLFGQSGESILLDDFAVFHSWANSQTIAGSSIILLLNNFTRFKEKLPHSPLNNFFPDYYPGPDPVTSARQYILRRFKDANQNGLSIYSFWVDLDMSDNHHLYAALKKTLLHIQQRKARSEVWETSTAGMSSPRNATAITLSRQRSGTVTTGTSSTRG
ncbi:hypothetical protein K469DRAFT_642978 [Zopfia rhizophila CBS 207.26]|uniref:Guanine nucleotide-binding protein-like protein alpha-3 subunit n=1 Tax=Zopfia rhizophila CBS 207.26 TaxID=1314779 RepID=A0A6A6DFL8_9PEZI|nr:hypothetical protein K469DRAFT_642978 [Zopfia rhizophila CBS 207.26]